VALEPDAGKPLAVGLDRLVPPMGGTAAGMALLFHVNHFTRRRDFAIATDDTSAWQRAESQQPDDAHGDPSTFGEAKTVPQEQPAPVGFPQRRIGVRRNTLSARDYTMRRGGV